MTEELKPHALLDAWIHWKGLELQKYPDKDEQMFMNDVCGLRAENVSLKNFAGRLEALCDELAETLKKINRSCSGDAVVYSRIALEKYEAMKEKK